MKKLNEHVDRFPDFERTPKAVIAAICYSLAERLGTQYGEDGAVETIRDEWHVLYANGIVPQKPIAKNHVEGA